MSESLPPSQTELLALYPAKFTWIQVKTFINDGGRLLRRHPALDKRYGLWCVEICDKYGSLVNYLLEYRLQWGVPDASSLPHPAPKNEAISNRHPKAMALNKSVPDIYPYFTVDTPEELISITRNDWPYSVPPDIEHILVWTKRPIFHPDLVAESIAARVHQYGLWGFTGHNSPPPSPSMLPSCLPDLSEFGMSIDQLVHPETGSEEEEMLLRRAGQEVDRFVKARWPERECETAWLVNPLKYQSVPGLAHFHVFARHKASNET